MGELLATAGLLKAQAEDLEALPLWGDAILPDGQAGTGALYSTREVIEALETIREASRILSSVARDLGDHAGDRWPMDDDGQHHVKMVEIDGLAAFERHARRDAKDKINDEEGLARLIEDTRVVDPATGEVLTPLQVAVRAYGAKSRETGRLRLTGTSRSKLEALGFTKDTLDEFFERNPRSGWTIQKR